MKDNKKQHQSTDINKDGKIGWNELDVKDKIGYVTAIASFILGWVLLWTGFLIPPLGVISSSVLTAFGTALVYASSFFGVALYFSAKDAIYSQRLDDMEKRLRNERNFENEEEDANV